MTDSARTRSRFQRLALAVALAVGCLQPPVARGDVADVVARTESAVASIVVSRSDQYRKLGLATEKDGDGKLGGFDSRYFERLDSGKIGLRFQDDLFERDERLKAVRLKLDLSDPQHYPESFGTGLVVDRSGLILTNFHVVQDATKVYVRLPGGKGSYADIWAADPRSDLAVLKLIDDRIGPLTPMTLGDADAVRRGQTVIALANAYAAGAHDGLPSVSVGVISNVRRRVPGRQPVREINANPLYQNGILLQTDARIVLGASGGALLDDAGRCIGITTSLAAIAGSDAPGGFALPVNAAVRKIIAILKRGEEVEYGYLGVGLTANPAPEGGAVVKTAQRGSPASVDAALAPGDVLVAIGNHPIRDNQDLMLALGLQLAGETVSLGVIRGGEGKEQKVDVTLVKYNVPGKKIVSSLGKRPFVDGLRVDYTSLLGQRPNALLDIPNGVLVTDVRPGSKAERLEIFPGDIIQSVGFAPVNAPSAFYDALARRPAGVQLVIQRGGRIVRVNW